MAAATTVAGMPNQITGHQAYLPPGLTLMSCDNRTSAERLAGARVVDANTDRPDKLERLLKAGVSTVFVGSDRLFDRVVELARRLNVTVSAVDERHRAIADVVADADNIRGVLPIGWDGKHIAGPFDIIGDVHGQLDALLELLDELGYDDNMIHPDGRIAVFVGDIVDKGPDPLGTFDYVAEAVSAGRALWVRGNHEHSLAKTLDRAVEHGNVTHYLRGILDSSKHGRQVTVRQLLEREDLDTYVTQLRAALARMPLHLVLDGGNLVVVHAAATTDLIGVEPTNSKGRNRQLGWFLYGPSEHGKVDENGFPVRVDWAPDYDGEAWIVHGHVTTATPVTTGKVVSVDTGAGDGDSLSAFAWPEHTFTTVTI